MDGGALAGIRTFENGPREVGALDSGRIELDRGFRQDDLADHPTQCDLREAKLRGVAHRTSADVYGKAQ